MNKAPPITTPVVVTSALPYVNNIPHLGNMICIISADIYTRFLRLQKYDVISVIGTDEHGTTTEVKALQEGITPQEICEKYFAIHKKIYEWFNTSYDCIGRTSSKENTQITQDIFEKLHKNGYILTKEVEQFFDEEKQTFLADRFIKGTCPHCHFDDAKGDQCDKCGKLLDAGQLINPVSTLSNKVPVKRKTTHLYIDLKKIEPKLRAWIDSVKHQWSENAQKITQSWLDNQLEARAITRDLKWGIRVPLAGFEEKVFYSWFDAPIGYIGISAQCKKDWKKYWLQHATLVQFMGKDNTAFHTILFPSFLLGTAEPYNLVTQLSVNEYLNYADGKFSKSRGTGVFGDGAMESGICADAYRYYLTAIRPENEDTTFDWIDFADKINKELIANYANLVNRVISLLNRYFDGKISASENNPAKLSQTLNYTKVAQLYHTHEQKAALKLLLSYSKQLNQYLQSQAPWHLVNTDKEKTGQILSLLANHVNDLTIALSPIIPQLTANVFEQLHSNHQHWDCIQTMPLQAGHTIGKEAKLLEKIEDATVQELRTKFGEKRDAFPLDLRVALVKNVSIHPQAEKLYVLELDVGDHTRTIVSGIRQFYSIEELVGKKIILVANLKPAMLRGVLSKGMLLAAQEKDQVKVLEAKFSPPGEPVFADGMARNTTEITIDDFAKVKMAVIDKQPQFEKKALRTKQEIISCTLASGQIR